jgi:hypothetical protein
MVEVDKKSVVLSIAAALAIFAMLFLHAGQLSSIRSTFAADGSTKAYVAPFYQVPGGSVIVSAEGLRPNATVTISAKNVVATVETEIAGESTKSVTFPDTVVVGTTVSNADGTLEWALGVPRDAVKVIERWISNSTGQEEVLKTVTTTYQFQGTVRIIVADEYGNTADAELLIIRWIPRSPFG